MSLTSLERDTVQAFEKRHIAKYAEFKERIRKRPLMETLARPSSLFRALIILPMPWVSFYTVLQLARICSDTSTWKYGMAFLVGYFMIDLVTGIVHMRFDTLKLHMDEPEPLMESIASGFQRHHALQTNWNHDDIFESGILTTGLLTFPFYVIYLGLYISGCITSPHVALGWTVFITAGMHVQIFHAAAHNTWKNKRCAHAVFRFLRLVGLVLDNKSHHLHHTRFDCNFSMINGWSNFLLNPLYQFLESNDYIETAMKASVQRQIYLKEKAQLIEPYFRMYPDYRAYQKRIECESTTTS